MQTGQRKIGLHEEFLSARDWINLTSVQALVDGILEGERKEGLNVIAIFDHEEVGSRTKQGAGSMMLPYLLEKIYLSLGGSEQSTRMHLRGAFNVCGCQSWISSKLWGKI